MVDGLIVGGEFLWDQVSVSKMQQLDGVLNCKQVSRGGLG